MLQDLLNKASSLKMTSFPLYVSDHIVLHYIHIMFFMLFYMNNSQKMQSVMCCKSEFPNHVSKDIEVLHNM